MVLTGVEYLGPEVGRKSESEAGDSQWSPERGAQAATPRVCRCCRPARLHRSHWPLFLGADRAVNKSTGLCLSAIISLPLCTSRNRRSGPLTSACSLYSAANELRPMFSTTCFTYWNVSLCPQSSCTPLKTKQHKRRMRTSERRGRSQKGQGDRGDRCKTLVRLGGSILKLHKLVTKRDTWGSDNGYNRAS